MHKILLVEDDQVIRQQVGKMLSEWGFEVVLVEDFMEVLSLFVQSEPHLVLMDIGLPLFNGYHWCQEIRKISKVPIMFLSSRDQAMDIVMAINMGADDFVTKPFDQQVLLAKVQAYCAVPMSSGVTRVYWNMPVLSSIQNPWIYIIKGKS